MPIAAGAMATNSSTCAAATAATSDDTDPERWTELEASDNVFTLVIMAQIRAKITDDTDTLKGWKFRLIRMLDERGDERALIL